MTICQSQRVHFQPPKAFGYPENMASIGESHSSSWTKRLVHLCFFLSGVAAVAYEIVWTRMFAIGLGHEMPSLLAVVAGFFAGLGVGAFALDRMVSRSTKPAAWYAGFELLIGLWGAATVWLVPAANELMGSALGHTPSATVHAFWAFTIPFLIMVPATAAMGATLSVVDRLIERLDLRTDAVGGLYSANTCGAMCGVLLSVLILLPFLGARATVFSLAAINVLCAAVIALLPSISYAQRSSSKQESKRLSDTRDPELSSVGRMRLIGTMFATGLLGIGYEILAIIAMSQTLHNTIYTFAVTLAVYLGGTAIGAALHRKLAARRPYNTTLRNLLLLLCAACLAGTLALAAAPNIAGLWERLPGGGSGGGLGGEIAVALAAFLVPTIVMGALFTHLSLGMRTAKGGIGVALGINTLGGCMASAIFGVLLLPTLGLKSSLALVALGYLPLLPLSAPASPRRAKPASRAVPRALWAPIGLLLVALPFVSLQHVHPPPGGRVLEVHVGGMGAVAVVSDPGGHRYLKVDDRFRMGGTATPFPDRRLLLLPMLLHPAPHHALVLGVGTGMTLGAASSDPDMHADGVELIPDVLRVIPRFSPENLSPQSVSNISLYAADARRFVRASAARYDLVVGDLFHPARDGAASLYTREHFQAIKEHLNPGGVFIQWLPLHQIDLEVLAIVTRTFLEVFPDAQALVAHFNAETPIIGLVGEPDRIRFSPDAIATRLHLETLRTMASDAGIQTPLDVLGCFIAEARSLRSFADAHSRPDEVNTDDRPLVAFLAPRYDYSGPESPLQRIETLLSEVSVSSSELADDSLDADTFARFQLARNTYIRALGRLASADVDRARALFLQAVHISHDFRPAYAQLLREAVQLASRDRPAAVALLDRLIQANPARMEALELEQRILKGEPL
jgi:spermidine synthase